MLVTIRRALLSVSDKTGVVDFARALVARRVEILSTGGTARTLTDAGIPVTEDLRVYGFPGDHGRSRQDACIRASTAACWDAAAWTTPSCKNMTSRASICWR
jgi:hypothetical protein